MKSIFKTVIVTVIVTFFIPSLGHSQSWSILGSGTNALKANGEIIALATDTAGNVYTAGIFRNNTGFAYVAKWNGTTWSELESLTSDPSGNIYAGGGDYTGTSGFLAKWNGSTWTNINSSFHSPYDVFRTIASDVIGNVYAAVHDTSAANIDQMYVVKWDGSSWATLGAFPTNIGISSIVADGNGNVYVSMLDNTYSNRVTKWNGSNWIWLGQSPNLLSLNQIFSLHIDNANNLYARAGQMVARWINNDWVKQGIGATPLDGGAGRKICSDLEGNIYATAPYHTQSRYKVQKWNGSNWNPVGYVNGADYTFNGQLATIVSDKSGNIYTAGSAFDSLGHYYVAKYTQSQVSPVHTVDKSYQALNIYPNPSTNDIFIQLVDDHAPVKISVFNILGQIVQSYSVSNNGLKSPFKINVGQLANAQYVIQIIGSNVNLSRRFTKG